MTPASLPTTAPALAATPAAMPAAMPAWAGSGRSRRVHQGRQSYHAGLAAEDIAARVYERRGDRILARRHRTPEGEIDLVVRSGQAFVFVEVKRRKYSHGFDSPVSEQQWRRLGCAALHYMLEVFHVTRTQPSCRFDVALVTADGQVSIIENARTFD